MHELRDIPNIGPAMVKDFTLLGISTKAQLKKQDPYKLYLKLNRMTGARHDPCVLDTFMAAIRYLNGAPKKPWWAYTAERKKTYPHI